MNNILGYKAPFDLYVGTDYCIKKGTILTKHPAFDFIYTSRPVNEIGSGYAVAKEIVETWEAVYERKTVLIKDLPLRENRKIIGYKLLKDLPQISKGKIGKFFNGEGSIAFYFDDSDKFFDFIVSFVENNKDWFEPVYEKNQEDLIHDIYKLSDKEFQAEFTKVMLEKYEIKEKE